MLEQIYPISFMEKRWWSSLLLGITYSVIGISIALFLFPKDPALVAVAITAILLIPSLRKLISETESVEAKESKDDLVSMFRDNKYLFKTYTFIFLGILISFAFFSTALPSLATNFIFKQQIAVLYGDITGRAILEAGLFNTIFLNNLKVLFICFLAALLIGDGGIFIITWNASVWGTIFGNLAKTAAINVGKNPFIYLVLILLSVFPHMILEAISYFTGAISGGVLSRGFVKEKLGSNRFMRITINTLIFFMVSIIILALGAFVESYVLLNLELYRIIIMQAFG